MAGMQKSLIAVHRPQKPPQTRIVCNLLQRRRPTRADRDALLKYDRSRTRARKEDAEAYGALLVARFEEQLAKEFSFNSDAWKAAHADANEAAQRTIAERCADTRHSEVGAARAQPLLAQTGRERLEGRRAELRKVAQSRADALLKAAMARIARDSIEFQGQLLAGTLNTAAAKALLDGLPAVESLMTPLDLETSQQRQQ